MKFLRTKKKYNGATLYVYECEKCGQVIQTTNFELIPKCKCCEVGNTYGTVEIKNMKDNHTFLCYCHDCEKFSTMTLNMIKKYKKCPFCSEKKVIDKETLLDMAIIGKIFGGLEVVGRERDTRLLICKCECGNICKVSRAYLTRSRPSNKIIGCDICRTKTKPMKYEIYKQLTVRYDVRFTLNDFTTFVNKAIKNNQDISYDKTKLLRSVFTLQDFVLTKKEEIK